MGSKEGPECPHYSQIRSIIVAHHDARGPAYAHHFGDHLLGDEEFCMQCDSHRCHHIPCSVCSNTKIKYNETFHTVWSN